MDSCDVHLLDAEFHECLADDSFFRETCGGALMQRSSEWCELEDGGQVCCGDVWECCEPSAGGIALGIIILVVILISIVLCSCACCRYVSMVYGKHLFGSHEDS